MSSEEKETNGEKITNMLVKLSKEFPNEFKKDVWNGILETRLNYKEKAIKMLEWCYKMLDKKI